MRDSAELLDLIRQSLDWFFALSPEEQRRHHNEQRRSWVRGELGLSHPEMTDAEIDAAIDRVIPLTPPADR